jgi:predicted component of type VI protein secretion system
MTWLEHTDGLLELPDDSELIVGTGAQATWRLRHADLMPRHFVVSTADGGASICPFSGDAVVALNGRQLPPGTTPLHEADIISAGSAQFRFWATTPSKDRGSIAMPPVTAHLVDTGTRSAVSLRRISTSIGRDASNTLLVDDADVPTVHAEVRREAGGHALRASGAEIVRVNGKPLSAPVLLNEGDEIQLGDRLLRYTREALPDGVDIGQLQAVSDSLELSAGAPEHPRYSPMDALPATLAVRTPMRAVAFVSSVIAAVAIATLLLLHRGP